MPGGRRRPHVIDVTRTALVRCLELRQGSAWLRVKDTIAVVGYTLDRAGDRLRSLRSDGAESLLAMAVTLLHAADVRTGFVGKPRQGGGRWQRYTLADLAQLAYGGQAPADLRRASRAIAGMVSLGWAWPTKQVRRQAGDDSFRSEAAVRRLNLDRLCNMLGTSFHLARDRRFADQKHGTNTASIEEARAAKAERQRRQEERRKRHDRLEGELRSAGTGNAGDRPPKPQDGPSGPMRLQDFFASFKA